MVDAFPAVTESDAGSAPLAPKAGRSAPSDSAVVSARGPSSAPTTVGPFRPGISTGTISAANFPAACAATARRCDSAANASCAARETPALAAVYSAWEPMWTLQVGHQSPSRIMPSTSAWSPIFTPPRIPYT